MRPTFRLPLDVEGAALLAAVESHLQDDNLGICGVVIPPNADLRIPEHDQHFFSPVLALKVADIDGRTMLLGRFAPAPHIWMFYMAVYGVLAMVATGGAMYGASQWMLDRSPWALWLVPLSLVLMGFVYGAAFIGQGLGSEQMYELRTFLDNVLESMGHVPSTHDGNSGPHRPAPGRSPQSRPEPV